MADQVLTDGRAQYHMDQNAAIDWPLATASKTADISKVLRRACSTDQQSGINRSDVEDSEDMMKLAREVARAFSNSTLDPEGPDNTITLLEDCIRLRRDSGARFRTQGHENTATAQSNRRHAHFLQSLTTLLDILTAMRKTPPSKSPSASPTDVPKCARSFAALDVDDVSDDLVAKLESAIAQLSTRTTSAPQKVLVKLKDDIQLPEFALQSLFDKLLELRIFISREWRQYMEGKLSLETAALLTEIATVWFLSLARSVVEKYPQFDTFDGVASHLGLVARVINGDLDHLSCSKFDPYFNDQQKLRDRLCSASWILLKLAEDLREARDHPDKKSRLRRPELEQHMKVVHPFGEAISAIWSELTQHSAEGPKQLDIFSTALRRFLFGGSMNIELVGMTQIQCDIASIVGPSYRHTRLLLDEAKRARAALSKLQKMARENCIAEETAGRYFQGLGENIKQATGMDMDSIGSDEAEYEPSKLNKHLPVLVGVRVAGLLHYVHSQGASMCNEDLAVLAAAHLYATCRHTKHLAKDWPDMEYFLRMHDMQLGLQDLGASPTPRLLAAKLFGLRLGVKALDYVKAGSAHGNSVLPRCPLLANATKSGATIGVASTFATAQEAKHGHFIIQEPDVAMVDILRVVARFQVANQPETIPGAILHRWQERDGPITERMLLRIVEASMVSEEPAAKFDRTKFFVKCSKILVTMQLKCRQELEEAGLLDSAATISTSQLFQVADEVSLSAAERERELQNVSGSGAIKQPDLLEVCSKVFQSNFNRFDNDVLCQQSLSKCSGHISPSEAPKHSKAGMSRPVNPKGMEIWLKDGKLMLTTPEAQALPPPKAAKSDQKAIQ